MDKEEKVRHLENLIFKVNGMSVNQTNINTLSEIINNELRNEENSEYKNNTYIFHLKETIKKELDSLLKSRKNPINRTEEFKDAVSNFKQDVNRYLGDLRQS